MIEEFNVLTYTQEMYELAFAKGEMITSFHIYRMAPQMLIPMSLDMLDIVTPTLLVIEESSDAADPLTFLSCEMVQEETQEKSEESPEGEAGMELLELGRICKTTKS